MTNYISADKLKYLNPEKRAILKENYMHYILLDGRKTFYIQDESDYYFMAHLGQIMSAHPNEELNIFVKERMVEGRVEPAPTQNTLF